MTEDYAAQVVKVLREHFPDLADPAAAASAYNAISQQMDDPRDAFEFIVDDPFSARWRLKARSDDRRRVRLAYFPVLPPGSAANDKFERTVNDALRALEA